MFSTEDFDRYWNDWSFQEENNYKVIKNSSGKEIPKYLKKGYIHFDLRFWFPERKGELKRILQDNLKIYHLAHKRKEGWSFSPFLKILMKTPRYKYQEEEEAYDLETKIRPICFASHLDSLIFSFYAYGLTRKYEAYLEKEGFSECVLAYRSNLGGKCNIQFSKEVFDEVKRRQNCTAIALDIKGYFDTIVHKTLKEKWIKVLGETLLPEDQLRIFKAISGYSYVGKNSILKKYNVVVKDLKRPPATLLELVPGNRDFEKFQQLRRDKLIVVNTERNQNNLPIGIPQGSGMSALLSNIYLIDFDKMLNQKAKKEGFMYRRYCDDILIVCDTDKAENLQKFVIQQISGDPYHLEIQPKKIEMTEFKQNSAGKIRAYNKKKLLKKGVSVTDATNERFYYKSLQYLGFEFNGQDVFIRSSSLSRYYRKMKSRIVKTISMAYSKNSKSTKVWKSQLFEKYTHLGKRNFIIYAYKASKKTYINAKGEIKEGFESKAIKNQVSRHFAILLNTLDHKNRIRYDWKLKKGKVINRKKI